MFSPRSIALVASMIRLLRAPVRQRVAFGLVLAALATAVHFAWPARLESVTSAGLGPFVAVAALIGRRAGGLVALGAATALILLFDDRDPSPLRLALFVGKWLIVVLIADIAQDFWLRAVENERTRAQEARLAQQRLELALEAGAIGTFEVDLLRNELRFNEKHCEICGWTGRQPIPVDVADEKLIFDADLAALQEARARALTGAGRYEAKFRIRRANDGAIRWVESRGQARFHQGAPVSVFGVTRDVTDEMAAAAALEERARLAEQDRLRAEELARERQRLDLALEAGAIGAFDVDLDHGEIHLNEKLRQIWGWPEDAPAMVGDLDRLIAEEDRAARQEQLRRAEASGRYNAQFRIRRANDGALRWLDTRGQVYFDGGRPNRVLGVTRDVTDEREAAVALEERARLAEQLTKLAEALPGVIYSYELPVGGVSFCSYMSPEVERLLGFPPSAFRRDLNLFFERISVEDARRMRDFEAASARELRMWSSVLRYNHPDRGEIWIESNAAPARREDGSAVWHGYMQDVTARENAARALAESEARVLALKDERLAALEEQARLAEQLTALASALPGAIYTFVRRADGSAYLSYAAPQIETLFGVSQEILGRDFLALAAQVNPDDLPASTRAETEIARAQGVWRSVFRYTHPEKGVIWLEGHAKAGSREDGRFVWHGYLVDVTERETAARALAESEARVRALKDERLAALEKLAARLAHEVNQPLAAAATLLAVARRRLAPLLEREEASGCAGAEVLDKAARQLLRAGQIIAQLREFSQHDEADKIFRSLHETIRETLCQLDGDSSFAGFEIVLRLEAERDCVLIDRVQIAAVLVNLLRNAAQASLPDGRRAIVIASRNAEDAIEISVIDYGSGLSEDARRHLFELFWTSKVSGMGVGLATSKAIVESHYGKIWPGDGAAEETVFTFSLPLMDVNDVPEDIQ